MQTLYVADTAHCGCCPVFLRQHHRRRTWASVERSLGRTDGRLTDIVTCAPGEITSTSAGANSRFGPSVAVPDHCMGDPIQTMVQGGHSLQRRSRKAPRRRCTTISIIALCPFAILLPCALMWSAALASKGTISREHCQRQRALEEGCEWECWLALVDVARAPGANLFVRKPAPRQSARAGFHSPCTSRRIPNSRLSPPLAERTEIDTVIVLPRRKKTCAARAIFRIAPRDEWALREQKTLS
jgi:hypothetical protein